MFTGQQERFCFINEDTHSLWFIYTITSVSFRKSSSWLLLGCTDPLVATAYSTWVNTWHKVTAKYLGMILIEQWTYKSSSFSNKPVPSDVLLTHGIATSQSTKARDIITPGCHGFFLCLVMHPCGTAVGRMPFVEPRSCTVWLNCLQIHPGTSFPLFFSHQNHISQILALSIGIW